MVEVCIMFFNILAGNIQRGHERQANSELLSAFRENTKVSIVVQGCVKGEVASVGLDGAFRLSHAVRVDMKEC